MTRRDLQRALQQVDEYGEKVDPTQGLNRYDARRVIYGSTWKQATRPGWGVNLARPKKIEEEDG